ncbi:conserved hypothetical protein [Verrucomicrobia bacterium]|nr:conserved hypothetical protein [Verrucomicrobiota bacterium]
MDIKQATKAYETWVAQSLPLIEADLRLKHQRMAESPFPFLRATFYRWAQLWPDLCSHLASAPRVLGVGDLHVENFGTWRDLEGRLVWGVNDFDEACPLPYPNDLVRLAVSAKLAFIEHHLSCDSDAACDAILEGYEAGLTKGGQPLVLADHHGWLRAVALSQLRDPVHYWEKLSGWPAAVQPAPADVCAALRRALPEPKLSMRIVHRQAGLGSLGRRRYTALADWRGGMIAREAKELRRSAWYWQQPRRSDDRIYYQRVIEQAVRAADPFVSFHKRWLLRRLAPDCSRIELASLPKSNEELRLLSAMGWETANLHLGTKGAKQKITKDLKSRPAKWLRKATEVMAQATLDDWKQWSH